MTTYIKIFNERISGLSKGVDETVDNWFLMSSPAPVVSIVAVYLLFVLKIGPAFMKNRKPYDLKKIMVIYNAFQVCYSIWMCRTSIKESNVMSSIFSKKCEIVRNREQNLMLYSGAWYYFFSKIIDLLDTTFFVLRKKQNQVSFLHVYHHTITALFSWGYLKYAPGEQGVIIGILNSGVHIIMYFYYMVSAMGPQYQKYLWWKKYMTSIQLIQFVLILSYMILVGAKGCNMPKTLTFFFVANTIIFLYLFGNFYRKTYNSKKGNSMASAALRAAGGMGCQPTNAFLAQGDQMKRLIDVNNNNVKAMKAE
ncbi:elongation of very long chain fatty acids protein 7-like [Teleopsis dalmanni]|uniref:elongation of very long chain fatty acids protein 7-like n=1 Tax=Teleopsis dalmanni TaxID=139649 RepID=UPI0018CF5EFD|nr:elongation of very long chain fatty acids protein 7-like [Teleopsis dalmanni]XP_037955397.1 elongation of very long chain fatty acids protein 7-like [Teleopsis dalmanni]XP_037956014.1 elongation of very long chain fatty acids protein 7-like [Teleopsis dalmanni]XP_037956100.1 elongation of very long chain fatty acids protein 7-like [Teleopsis dalmanni]